MKRVSGLAALSMLLLEAGCLQDGSGAPRDGGLEGGGLGADSASPDGDASLGDDDATTDAGTEADADGGSDATSQPDAPKVPTGSWVNVTANLAGLASECGNVSNVTAKPDEDVVFAGIALKGIWATTDGGNSWHPLGTGAGSDTITNRTSTFFFDPSDSTRFWESGLYNGAGVYTTSDDGVTFTALGIGPSDQVSVDVSDPARQTLLAGGHEQEKSLSRSSDGGKTWTPVGASLPSNTNCTYPFVVDAQKHFVGCGGYGNGFTGIYRTTDGAQTWSLAADIGGTGRPLVAADQSIYWVNANNTGMARSTDSGDHWTQVTQGTVLSIAPIELPDGRIAAMSSDGVVVSADKGASWTRVSTKPPITPNGLTYSRARKAFFTWYFTCSFDASGSSVPGDAIQRYDFDPGATL